MTTLFPTLAVSLAALAALAASEPLAAHAGDRYDGKYAGDAAFEAQLERLPELQRAALAKVKKRLGLEPKRAARIRVEVRDAIPAEPETLAPTKDPAFATFTDGKGADAPIVIRLQAEAIRSGHYDLGEELAHEMVHAVMRERLDEARYAAIPKWLREGLALWTAEQGATRVAWILTQREALDGRERWFPGLGSGEHDLDRYAEDFLAIERIELDRGAAAVVKLAKLLVDGTPPEEAVAQACGRPFAKFVEESRRDAIGRSESWSPAGWPDFREISRLDRERKYADVITAATRFEASHPKSPLVGDVVYFRGKAERLASQFDAAATSLARLVGEGRLRCHYWDEALYQLGRVELERKRPAEAAAAFGSLLRDVPDTSLLDPAGYWLAVALAEQGKPDDARRWLDRFTRSFPKSKVAADAAKLRERLR